MDAQWRCRVEGKSCCGDGFLTTQTKTIFPVRDTIQSRFYLAQFVLTALSGFRGHGLRLHGVHARHASDPGLIEFDRIRCIATTVFVSEQLCPAFGQQVLEVQGVYFRHGCLQA